MQLKQIHNVYFIGIGGIGMSALARWFHREGKQVTGYDKTRTLLTDSLSAEGVEVHFEDDVQQIPSTIIEEKEHSLVIYTPAIPKEHKEFIYLREQGLTILKRSEVLGLITNDLFTVAVAGTHGKTTTSSMIAHILHHAGKDMVAFLGGVATNYATNLISNGLLGEGTIAIVEADEFDRSFLTLNPDVAVITSIDPDHMDIYGDESALKRAFTDFIEKIKNKGQLILHQKAAAQLPELPTEIGTSEYSRTEGGISSADVTIEEGIFGFDYLENDKHIKGFQLGLPGFHNVENALAAIAVSLHIGIEEKVIREALRTYAGVKRRFEYILKNGNVIFIDDYAHHPVEIKAFLESVRSLYPEKKITAVFQPHLYTRTRDFAKGFAESLNLADEVFLMEIYPAREAPIKGVSAAMIYEHIEVAKQRITNKGQLFDKVKVSDTEVITTIGAGNIDRMVGPLKKLLEDKYEAV